MTEHTSSYYAASANKYAPFDTLNESISCDVCVVGGGYTGLSSALHLAEAGFDVVVLEASRIGFGASGRNGGQLVNSYSRDIDVIEKSYGMDTARMLGSMMFEGGEIIRERIKRYQIYSAAIFLIPICISFDTAEKRRYATYLILNRRFSFEF